MLQCDRFELNLKRRGQLHKQATSLVVYVIYVYRRKSLYVGAVSYTTYKLQSKWECCRPDQLGSLIDATY